ncbi:MAG TPA: peptidoglycan DD-metalloendopeptidase family protein [Malonomonas sp.]
MLRLPVLLILLLLVACGGGVYHTVKPGQNLYRISRAYNVDKNYLARVNGISDPSLIKVGTRLYIPGATKTKYVAPVKENVQPPPPAPKPAPVKRTKSVSPAASPTRKTTAAPQVNATSIKKLSWPLRGKIVRSFSTQARAGGGKGIEIAVRSGSPVLAAEAGKAIYSGDGVNGYGHLIILQHENELFTVYGFNQKNLVLQGDFVSQGEKIALSGTPPAGGQARLHFEVRRGKQAVDPILYLP